MPGTDVQGPDGKDYQFPDGTTKDQAIAYFKKKGIGVSAANPQTAGAPAGPSGAAGATDQDQPGALKRFAQSFGMPTSMAELQAGADREAALPWWQRALPHSPGSSPSPASSIAGAVLGPGYDLVRGWLGQSGKAMGEGWKDASEADEELKQGQISSKQAVGKTAAGAVHGVVGSIPFLGPTINTMGEDAFNQNWRGFAGGGAGVAAQILGPKAVEGAVNYMRPGLTEAAHNVLGNAATGVKQTVGQGGPVHQAISQQFGKLTNDIVAADYASGQKIPINDIWEKALEHADDYAAGKTTPKFNAIVQEIQNRPTELTWKELHDLQQNVDRVSSTAQEGSRDAAAASQMRNAIAKKLDTKAAEVGRGEQWDAAKTIWRTLKEYQGDGVLSKLLNTGTEPVAPGGVSEGGKAFFDVLNDPANKGKLTEINKGFEPYGLPADYFKNIAKSNSPLHEYLALQSRGPTGQPQVSRMRLALQHPGAAIPPMMVGGAIGTASGIPGGSFLGGSLGALAGVRGAARARALSALDAMGGAPEISSPLTEASKVRPIGTGDKPTAPAAAPGAVSMDELTDALKSLGYKKADAVSLARQGISEYPNDFNAALKRAMQGPSAASKAADIQKVKSVSGGSQASERGTYSADPRTTEQILARLQELKQGGQGKVKTQEKGK